ncbi:uncharacterized protein PAC_06109 [Phialocephala subalpina]|uniref:Uncharacterized protein n=1 Tax=Phialocephala subalpina TaxID=576137 RepID=A0A1L7WTW3_9HELO|nr:uncharacterized protein PAC_06109 [Phialocephala subalpina]
MLPLKICPSSTSLVAEPRSRCQHKMQLPHLLTIGTAALGFAATSLAAPVSHSKTQKLSSTASLHGAVNITGYHQSKNASLLEELHTIELKDGKPFSFRELPSDLKDLDDLKKEVHDADLATLKLIGMEFGHVIPGMKPSADLTLRSRLLTAISKKYREIGWKSMRESHRHHKNKTLGTRDLKDDILKIFGLDHAESNKTLATRGIEEDILELSKLFGFDDATSNKTLTTRDFKELGWNWNKNKTAKAHPAHVEHKRLYFPKTDAKGRPFRPYTNYTKSAHRHHHLTKPHHRVQNSTKFVLWIESLAKAKANKLRGRSNETRQILITNYLREIYKDPLNAFIVSPLLKDLAATTENKDRNASFAEKHIHRRSNETNPAVANLEHALSLFPFFKFIKDISDKNLTDEATLNTFIEEEFGNLETEVPVLNVTDSGSSKDKNEAASADSDPFRDDWHDALTPLRVPIFHQAVKTFNGTMANVTEPAEITSSEEGYPMQLDEEMDRLKVSLMEGWDSNRRPLSAKEHSIATAGIMLIVL